MRNSNVIQYNTANQSKWRKCESEREKRVGGMALAADISVSWRKRKMATKRMK
jgi:hypothetical protein